MFTDEFSFRQFIYLVTFYTVCMIIEYQLGLFDIEPSKPIETYGYVVSIGLYLIKMLPMLIAAPLTYFNILTTLFIFDEKKNKQEPVRIPQETVCFRVVTRGMFPNLVKKNKDMNLSTLKTYESLNYTYEIVTDKELGIEGDDCYEVLVPSDYETKNGAKFKARALQYALERNESKLNYNDWIVHLDEETLLTKRSINGILKFCTDNKHPIGQGEFETELNRSYLTKLLNC
jgi:egghead protein (zeste-white 4 protein)